MADHFDDLETRPPEVREKALFEVLPRKLAYAVSRAPGWARQLADVDTTAVTDRAALARLPVLRKADLMTLQAETPPFGGFETATSWAELGRVFMSPGPIWEPSGTGPDPWNAARALHAAGVRHGDLVLNTFSYHMTPGAWILDAGARALGAAVMPGGVGNTEQQVAAIAAVRPGVYCGVPDFLKILLDKAAERGADVSSVDRALVSGAALPRSLRDDLSGRGVSVLQCYATADLGVVAYESEAREGLIVNEDVIVEIVRPGTGEPVPEGEVGEVVVTRFHDAYPLFRFATGDLSAILPGESPCGRTNMRIRTWMGRADQRTKVKGMFVDPAQVDRVVRRVPGVGRARLVVTRENEQDVMTLRVEARDAGVAAPLAEALKEETRLSGAVEVVGAGTLPNDGKVIADERPVEA